MGVLNYTTEKINELLDKIDKAPETIENGKTPVFVTGTTTTLDPGLSATAEVVQDGVDDNGNPKYKINLGVPKGLDGASGGGGGVADSVQWTKVLNKPSWVDSPTKPTYTASEVGALPAGTTIPSKTSQLTNDSKFLKSTDFKTINGQSIVGSGNIQIEGGPSGGTGNVNVTNASGLLSSQLYSFKPSKYGSLEGTFQEIAKVNETTDGLMRSEDYSKLKSIKGCVYLPIAFERVNSSTSKEELVQLFSKAFEQEDLSFAQLVLILTTFSTLSDSDGNGDSGSRFFVGNNECLFRGLYTEAENKLLTEFTFITIGGSLKTISILFSNLQSDFSTAEMTISIIDSDDDSYYLPIDLYNLTSSSTGSEITSALGGSEGVEALKDAMRANKKIYVVSSEIIYYFVFPVSYSLVLNTSWAISFVIPSSGVNPSKIRNITSNKVKDIYPEGFWLDSSFYTLRSSSSSEDISSAIGGESGMKKLIQAISDGNSVCIKNASDLGGKTDILCNTAKIEENGNMSCVFFGMGYYLWGGGVSMILINYNKTSNTFSATVTSMGS